MERFLGLEKFRRMFYLVTPNETLYGSLDAVPNMPNQALPIYFVFIVVELIGCWTTKQMHYYDLSDSFTSLGAGLLNRCIKPWVWVLSFLLVDLGYYWFHRACHESLILWAVHQLHHSSDYLNMTTGMRHGPLERYVSIFFYLPACLFVPPNVHLAHMMLGGLYQIWIHTELIRTLGPLDWLIVTPSNHRVHHGRNPYCVNKNYGGTLILWDRLFGTFEPERSTEKPVYGLVFSLDTFDHIWAQLFMFKRCFWDKPGSVKGWQNKIKATFYVPSWFPGLKYKIYEEVVPKVKLPVVKYKIYLPWWVYGYISLHFGICGMGYFAMVENAEVRKSTMSAHIGPYCNRKY